MFRTQSFLFAFDVGIVFVFGFVFKMNFSSVFIILSLFSIHGHITIEIEPEDLNRISEILQTIINEQQLQPIIRSTTRNSIIPVLKKITCSVFQMLGIMLTLVGANFITMKMEPSMLQQTSDTNISSLALIEPPGICKSDYGCNANLCWRTCNENDSNDVHVFHSIKEKWNNISAVYVFQ